MDIQEQAAYYRRGGPCLDYNDVCRHRPSGCPCTDTANTLERLNAVLEAAEALIWELGIDEEDAHVVEVADKLETKVKAARKGD